MGLTERDDANIINVGASKTAIDRLGFGLGGKFIFPTNGSHTMLIDSVFSTTFIATAWLNLALIGDNLIETAAERQYGFYRQIILGTKFNIMGLLLVYADPHWTPDLTSDSTWGYELGLEIPIMSDFFVRLGDFSSAMVPYLNLYGHGYSVGLGWMAPKVSFDYALQRVVSPVGCIANTFGMTLYF